MPVKTMRVNTAAKAITSGNKMLSRAEILGKLGLDPRTPPEAWLAIVACGSNASALKATEARTLVDANKLRATSFHRSVVDKIR